jgi:hypothetical protein
MSIASETPSTNDPWDVVFDSLVEFRSIYGHFRIPRCYYAHNGIKLCQWLLEQRILSKNQRLDPKKKSRLVAVGVNLKSPELEPHSTEHQDDDDDDDLWNHMYEGLVEFQKTLGHLKVPTGCDYYGFSLYDWVKEQRARYTKDLHNRASWQDKIDRLQLLGFELDTGSSGRRREQASEETTASSGPASCDVSTESPGNGGHDRSTWSLHFRELKRYKDIHGHLKLPKNYHSGGRNLYEWLKKQRHFFACTLILKICRSSIGDA